VSGCSTILTVPELEGVVEEKELRIGSKILHFKRDFYTLAVVFILGTMYFCLWVFGSLGLWVRTVFWSAILSGGGLVCSILSALC
jgi:hypothetical protein